MSGEFAALAELFRYPDGSFSHRLDVAQRVLCEDGALDAFAVETSSLGTPELEATYTSTFDLAPSCSPYLGAHLFGSEDRDRGRLLLGLRSSCQRAGVDVDDRELPDHIAHVLQLAAHEEQEEWPDLVRLILVPALEKMEALVAPSTNPYRHLIAAAHHAGEVALCRGGQS
jgi:nitrate reductase delta subunit